MGKRILITGGTGSFGNKAVRVFLEHNPEKIILYSRDEYKQFIMRNDWKTESRLEFVIGDVRDPARLKEAMGGAHWVIHAAAMKQVPACEDNVLEAIKTNIAGTQNVLEAAKVCGVECVIHLSADKALYPVSVYGASKMLAERLVVQANQRSSMRCVNLRYSNVIDSRGAVGPMFRRQIEKGGTITVFDERMRRFFVTQREIVEACLYIFEHSVGGETFVKVSEPVAIVDLARIMIDLYGKGQLDVRKGEGRSGEKLDAVVLSAEEGGQAVKTKDMIVVNNLKRKLPYGEDGAALAKDLTMEDFGPMAESKIRKMVQEELMA